MTQKNKNRQSMESTHDSSRSLSLIRCLLLSPNLAVFSSGAIENCNQQSTIRLYEHTTDTKDTTESARGKAGNIPLDSGKS
jgi:hypothetical protein